MKLQKIKAITVASVIVIILVVILSYKIEARSQKLPAVIRSEEVIVSSEIAGTIEKYFVSSMQEVVPGQQIAVLSNLRLTAKLATLQEEKAKYEELIASAQAGDHLKLELFKLEDDILDNSKELKKAELELKTISEKLAINRLKFQTSRLQYEGSKKLFTKKLLSIAEFETETNKYLSDLAKFNDQVNDSLLAVKEIETLQNIAALLEAEKYILNNNSTILAADHLIDLDKVNADIKDLEHDIENLTISSPIKGVITDINKQPGEKVKSGDEIVEIADLSKIWIIAYGSSSSSHRVNIGSKVRIYCGCGVKIMGKVITVSPVMERVKSLSTSFETVNTYTKIEIDFDDQIDALQYVTPGERLFVRIYF